VRTICITIHDAPRAMQHFVERGVNPLMFHGLDAARLGLRATHLFTDHRANHPITTRIGVWLSHRSVWAACLLMPVQGDNDEFLIIEEDAKFPVDWKERLETARQHLPSDWDALYVGSCCALSTAPVHIAGEIFEFVGRYPMCSHALMLRRKALPKLIAAMDAGGMRQPFDVALGVYAMPQMRVFGVLPRIVDQWDRDLEP
jgi:GR25 family glycosyltransferase involved in LPS biosynthesis